jgi:hypothetical protein
VSLQGQIARDGACQECECYKLETRSSDEVLKSSCSEIVEVGCAHVFGELLTVFNCSL